MGFYVSSKVVFIIENNGGSIIYSLSPLGFMCGIYGCIKDNAADEVLSSLRKLEYRGYDSAGLAAIFEGQTGPIKVEKSVGYVSDLAMKADGQFDNAIYSIGHTRWATHGRVTETNAHPHSSSNGMITVVHNGIIENASEIHEFLLGLGYQIKSETDSEVIAHLIDHELNKTSAEISYEKAFELAISRLKGTWAVACLISGLDGILISRNGSPLIIGKNGADYAISSDFLPLYGGYKEAYLVEDGENILVTKMGAFHISNTKTIDYLTIEGEYLEQNPGDFSHMMLKEINDQPVSLANTIGGRLNTEGDHARLSGFELGPAKMRKLERINLVGCGTAYYASLLGEHYIRSLSSMEVRAFRSSEFDQTKFCGENTLTIGISQSGETKDTLEALKKAKSTGGYVSSICNVIGSSIARFTNNGAYLHSGPEYAVASTKAFTGMVATLLMLALTINDAGGAEVKKIIQDLKQIPALVRKQLNIDINPINEAAKILAKSDRIIVLGKEISLITAQEAALKLMEITYIPTLACAAGELKHGPLALVEEGTPIIVISPFDQKYAEIMASNIEECRARGGKIILISSDGSNTSESDIVIKTKSKSNLTSPIVDILPIQQLSFQVALIKGLNPDRPRNLAKSVTVL